MGGERRYSSGVEKALFVLSSGFCYAPTCKNPVVKLNEDNEPSVEIFIAHICAANKNGARYDKSMSPDERKSFPNLLLLCGYHHNKVDAPQTRDQFSKELLLQWKSEREAPIRGQITALSNLTEDRLAEMLVESASSFRDEMMTGIGEIKGISEEARDLLRELVDAPFTRQILDPDHVASLEYSARTLTLLQDYAPMLSNSARNLVFLQDYVPMLADSSRALIFLQDYTPILADSARQMGSLQDYMHTLSEFTRSASSMPDTAGYIHRALDRLPNLVALSSEIDRLEEVAKSLRDAEVADDLGASEPYISQEGLSWASPSQRDPGKLRWQGIAMGAAFILAVQLVGIFFFPF